MHGMDPQRTWGWYWIRLEFGIALVAVALTVLAGLAAPSFIDGLSHRPLWYEDLIRPSGLGGVVVGFGWMWRIATANPESGFSAWRSRPRGRLPTW